VNRAYRRHIVRIGIALVWLVPVWFFAVFALDMSPDGVPVAPAQRLVYAALALVFLALAVRTFRIGVFTRPSGVVVRNTLRTTKLAWEEIAAFEWGLWRGWGSFACGVVRREDGRQVTCFALNPPFELTPGEDRRVPAILAELNQTLAQARGWPEPPPSRAPDDPRRWPAAPAP
jgi:hypothetical protein